LIQRNDIFELIQRNDIFERDTGVVNK